MNVVLHLLLTLVGFGVPALMIHYLDPEAIDVAGFGIFYFALTIGSFNLFLLLRLSRLQAGLLSFLLVAFGLLQQFRLFSFWFGLILVLFAIIIEQYAGGPEKT